MNDLLAEEGLIVVACSRGDGIVGGPERLGFPLGRYRTELLISLNCLIAWKALWDLKRKPPPWMDRPRPS